MNRNRQIVNEVISEKIKIMSEPHKALTVPGTVIVLTGKIR